MTVIIANYSYVLLIILTAAYIFTCAKFEKQYNKLRVPSVLVLLLFWIAAIYLLYTDVKDHLRGGIRINNKREMWDYELNCYMKGLY